jgi:hypothetical protein
MRRSSRSNRKRQKEQQKKAEGAEGAGEAANEDDSSSVSDKTKVGLFWRCQEKQSIAMCEFHQGSIVPRVP